MKCERVAYRVTVQLAAHVDVVDDATVHWPDSREEVDVGTVAVTERAGERDPEMRKIIFDAISLVDGIKPAGDPLFEVRAVLYLLRGRRRGAAK